MSASNKSSIQKANTLLGLQFVSDFGDQITAALLALLVVDITNSTSKVGFVYVLNVVGFLVFTLFGGYLGDRFSKRQTLFCADIGRGLVVLLMIAAIYNKSMGLIYLSSFLLSMLSSIHRPIRLGIWSRSVPHNRHELYNCFSELSTHSSLIVGPLIASLLLTYGQQSVGFALDALTFFICGLTFLNILSDKSDSKPNTVQGGVFDGFKLIFSDQELRKYVSFDAIQMLTHGAFNATLLILLQRDFGFSKAEYSFHLAIAAIFSVAGALLGASRYIASLSIKTRLVGCNLITALTLVLMLYFKTFPLASIFFGICNTAFVVMNIVTKTRAQMRASHAYPTSLSSILAARSIVIKFTTLCGVALCLVTERFLSLEATLWLCIAPLLLAFFPIIQDVLEWDGKNTQVQGLENSSS